MGDRGAAALASVLQEGAMANLETLGLYSCGIGEAWMVALASAAVGGAVPSCKEIALQYNPGSAAAVKEAARGAGASRFISPWGALCWRHTGSR